MKSFVITGSITKAYLARDILNKYGIKTEIKRQPNNLKRLGCGYGVIVDKRAVEVLKQNGIKILGILEI